MAPTLIPGTLEDLFAAVSGKVDMSGLLDIVQVQTGKPIAIEMVGDSSWGTLTGLLLESDSEVRILLRECDPPLYQSHCLLHELGHLLLRHGNCASDFVPHRGATTEGVLVARGRLLSDPADADEELAAEAIAYSLARRLLRNDSIPAATFGL